ncbi:hypothetical protein WA026_000281 [Henosepilachna vigintioctopunctata]|uniref:Nucleoside diphosphate kinase n=1 Tax=Henosepilachna vigintioctopunctata TaxID=420089 RepID=A0AAW1V4M5_9CUCU
MNMLEVTLAILKPHLIKNPVSMEIVQKRILNEGFKIVNSKIYRLTQEDAEKFYAEHKSKFFYNRLVTSMISGPSGIYVLAKENAIKHWRELMGPTKVYKAQFDNPHSIRGELGLSDTRNATHGSDSPESARREIEILFPEFNLDKWYKEEKIHFENGNVILDEENFIHKIKST